MGLNLLSYVLAKKYVDKTADSLGSLKGAPCTISNIEEKPDSSIVNFRWTGTSGDIETAQLTIKNGLFITGVNVNKDNQIICTLSDGTTLTTGNAINVTPVDLSKYVTTDNVETIVQEQVDETVTDIVDQKVQDAVQESMSVAGDADIDALFK